MLRTKRTLQERRSEEPRRRKISPGWLLLSLAVFIVSASGVTGEPYDPDVTALTNDSLGQPNSKEGRVIHRSRMIASAMTGEYDSPDVAMITGDSTTQSENSVFVDPNNPLFLLNSNNSLTSPVISVLGTSSFMSTDGGQTWTGTVLAPGGVNKGDPATAIDLNGRLYIGHIQTGWAQGVSYSDDQGVNWTAVQVAPGGYALDKNHLWVDNSTASPYVGNLYSAWTNFQAAGNRQIDIARSVNGGVSWGSRGLISGASHFYLDQGVNIQTGPNGEVYVTWTIYESSPSAGGHELGIGFAKSMDGGVSYTPATRVLDIYGHRPTPLGGGKTMRHNSFPSMTVNQQTGEIFIVWTNIGVPGVNTGDPDIYVISSVDGGTNWSTPVRVNQDTQSNGLDQYFPWITCDPVTGMLACIFYDCRNFPANDMVETFVALSTDNGATWEDFRVSDAAWSGDGFSGSYAGDYLGIASRDGKVYPVWGDDRTGTFLTYISPFEVIGAPHVVSVSPAQNQLNTGAGTDIAVTFDVSMDEATFNSSTYIVNASSTGPHAGTFSYDDATLTVTFNPDGDFASGEHVNVILTTGIQSASGAPLDSSFIWTFTTAVSALSPGTFVIDATYTVGDLPYDVYAADLDDDGDLDLVTANRNTDDVSVMMNNGDGSYASPAYYSAVHHPTTAVAGDFDSDGDIDIAVANWNATQLSIYANNGNGTLAPRADYPSDSNAVDIEVGDLDGDGDLDLVVPCWNDDFVRVFTNDGNGVFAMQGSYPAGDGPNEIAVGDFDGDGDIDLVMSNSWIDSVVVLLNNGDATFAPQSFYAVGDVPAAVAAADFDGDGDLDLVTCNKGSNDASVLLNNGDGTFGMHSVYPLGAFATSIDVGDFDGDGDLDVATANLLPGGVSILMNDGDGTFTPDVTYPTVSYPIGIFVADVDNDGDVDLVMGNQQGNQVTVLANRSLNPPNAPVLASPPNGITTFGSGATLRWHAVTGSGVDRYEIWVDDNSDFSSPNYQRDDLIDTSWTSPVLADGWWYWKVRAHNEEGWGAWSAAWSFRIRALVGCPILFSHDGNGFVRNNPLLTACEYPGNVGAVIDYYLVTKPVVPDQGQVTFQIRETVDEVTQLDDLELITVDHSDATLVACGIGGRIYTYEETVPPLSAVDHNGIDRLDELVSEDGNVFSSSGPGYLVLTFPSIEGEGFGLVTSAPKKPPFETEKRAPDANPVLSEFTVARLDEDGGWNETANLPPRETPTQEVVFFERETGADRQTVTVRISWTGSYATDAVYWFAPSDERPVVKRWTIQHTDLSPDKPANREWTGFGGNQSLILTKGDVFEFSFACTPLMESEMKRDYIVRAKGRYGRNLADIAGAVPGQFQLHANHPNPFNAATTIDYELAAARHVKLNIYNVLGQHVATLVNARQEAGHYSVVWDGRDDSGLPAASGLYLTRMIAGEHVSSQKMIMLK